MNNRAGSSCESVVERLGRWFRKSWILSCLMSCGFAGKTTAEFENRLMGRMLVRPVQMDGGVYVGWLFEVRRKEYLRVREGTRVPM
jgi:hypothetical protein